MRRPQRLMGGVALLCVLACDAPDPGDAGTRGRDANHGVDAPVEPCAAAVDGEPCGDTLICVSAACVASACGDGVVDDRTEVCDDGNLVAFDGCEPTCSYTCSTDSDCADDNVCNGMETCDTATHVCVNADPGAPTACALGPGAVVGLGGARTSGTVTIMDERFEGLGYRCQGPICASGRIEP